jgi:dTDP-4-amino-4,6-dideoxygalactose transaminase
VIHYPIPPHHQKAYPELSGLSLPITEVIHREVLSLPISPIMPVGEVGKIVNSLSQFIQACSVK